MSQVSHGMIDPIVLQQAVNLPFEQAPDATVQTLRTVGNVGITLAAVKTAGMIGRRAVMGHFLHEGVDTAGARMERDPHAIIVLAVAYTLGVALTTGAVYLAVSLSVALGWAGACAFVASVVALQASRNASPVDDIRLLANRGE